MEFWITCSNLSNKRLGTLKWWWRRAIIVIGILNGCAAYIDRELLELTKHFRDLQIEAFRVSDRIAELTADRATHLLSSDNSTINSSIPTSARSNTKITSLKIATSDLSSITSSTNRQPKSPLVTTPANNTINKELFQSTKRKSRKNLRENDRVIILNNYRGKKGVCGTIQRFTAGDYVWIKPEKRAATDRSPSPLRRHRQNVAHCPENDGH